MIRRLLALLLMLAAVESAALACSCVPPPRDAAQRRALARDIATGALALVEVELVTPYERPGRGERLRVRRMLAGRAPALFYVERSGPPSSASCDIEFGRGVRSLVVLYPPEQPVNSRGPHYRLAASCVTYLLTDAAFRAALIREFGRHR